MSASGVLCSSAPLAQPQPPKRQARSVPGRVDRGELEPQPGPRTKLEALLTKAGQTLPDKATFTGADGNPDQNGYGSALRRSSRAAEHVRRGRDRRPRGRLPVPRLPVQPGRHRRRSSSCRYKSGESVEYRGQRGLLPRRARDVKMFFPIIKDDLAGGQALVAGQADWKYSLTGPDLQRDQGRPGPQVRRVPGLRLLRRSTSTSAKGRSSRTRTCARPCPTASTRRRPSRPPPAARASPSTARSRPPRGPTRPRA